jgi:hypothetical protein
MAEEKGSHEQTRSLQLLHEGRLLQGPTDIKLNTNCAVSDYRPADLQMCPSDWNNYICLVQT